MTNPVNLAKIRAQYNDARKKLSVLRELKIYASLDRALLARIDEENIAEGQEDFIDGLFQKYEFTILKRERLKGGAE